MNVPVVFALVLAMAAAPALLAEPSHSTLRKASSAAPPPQSPSLCTASEQVIFACSIGKKLLSVCGSKELTQTTGYLQYRFGRSANDLELEFPSDKAPPSQWFRFASPFQGAKSSLNELQFQQSDYRYTVSAFTSTFSDAAFGVKVVAPDGKLTHLHCAPIPVANERLHILHFLNLQPTLSSTEKNVR